MKVKDLIPVTVQQHGNIRPIIIWNRLTGEDATHTYSLEHKACVPYYDCEVIRLQGYDNALVITIEK